MPMPSSCSVGLILFYLTTAALVILVTYPLLSRTSLSPYGRSKYPSQHLFCYLLLLPLLTYLLTYLLISLLTPWNRVLLSKITGSQLAKKIPRVFWNPKVHYHIYNNSPPVLILSKIHLVHAPTSQFLKIHLNITLPSTPWSPKWSLPFRFPQQDPIYTSFFPHTCYITRPSHSSQFDHPNNIG